MRAVSKEKLDNANLPKMETLYDDLKDVYFFTHGKETIVNCRDPDESCFLSIYRTFTIFYTLT